MLKSGSSQSSMKAATSYNAPSLDLVSHKDTSLNVGTNDVAIDIKVDTNEFTLRRDKYRGDKSQREGTRGPTQPSPCTQRLRKTRNCV